jgi:hypothetical protein
MTATLNRLIQLSFQTEDRRQPDAEAPSFDDSFGGHYHTGHKTIPVDGIVTDS